MVQSNKSPLHPTRRAALNLMALGGAGLLLRPRVAMAKSYGPGVSDTEIKIGSTMPYSGPAAFFGATGRVASAYYKMINDRGGVNGRKIECISLDDGFSPPKAVEQVRRLVEQDQVLGIFGSLGTPTNVATHRYLNEHKVPQFFIFSGVSQFRDPVKSPWTIAADLSFVSEGTAFARYILATVPSAKIAVLYQNDDMGKDHLLGLRVGLGEKADTAIVKAVTYEPTDPSIESQMIQLQASGANVLVTAAIPKFASMAIRKMHDIGWNPLHCLGYPAASIPATFKPAGLEASVGIVTADYVKQAGDPAWASDPEMLAYLDFMKTYAAGLDPNDKFSVGGYYQAAATIQVLSACGDDLTRENLLKQMTQLHRMTVPMLLPGITMSTSPDNYTAIGQMQMQRFDGKGWEKVGGIMVG